MAKLDASTKSPLGRARGLGSAKEGTHHWIMQRVTAIALIPLCLWFIVSLIKVAGAERDIAMTQFGHPITALMLAVAITLSIYHAVLGLQVILEDYVHHDGLKHAAIWAVRSLGIFLSGVCVVAILIMVFVDLVKFN